MPPNSVGAIKDELLLLSEDLRVVESRGKVLESMSDCFVVVLGDVLNSLIMVGPVDIVVEERSRHEAEIVEFGVYFGDTLPKE